MQDWHFERSLLHSAEQQWPYPLASTCRNLRVATTLELAISAGTHLYELLLKHLYILAIVEYLHLSTPQQRVASYLINRAFRGNLTCGALLEGLRLLLPYLYQHSSELRLPQLAELWACEDFKLESELLQPLNLLRVQWSHPKGHVAHQLPQVTDFIQFRDLLSRLMAHLTFFAESHCVYTLGFQQKGGQTSAQVFLLEGAATPFEQDSVLVMNLSESHQVGLYLPESQQIINLYPFYLARSEATGVYEMASLHAIRKGQCHWEPDWPNAPQGETAYLEYMQRVSLPEPPEDLTVAASGDSDGPYSLPVDDSLPNQPLPSQPLAPTFRNATWRMFAMDWELQSVQLENHSHYDALSFGPDIWAVWRYLPQENAYLLGLRPRFWSELQARYAHWVMLGENCPGEYRAEFVPARRGHWHDSHYHWCYAPSQNELGALIQDLDRLSLAEAPRP